VLFEAAHHRTTSEEFYASIEAAGRAVAQALADARCAPSGHLIDDTGAVRKIKSRHTNIGGPIYDTAMFMGETVMVLLPAESAKGAM